VPKKPESVAYNLRDIDQAVAEAHLLPPARKIVGRRGGPHKIQVSSRKNQKNMPAFHRLTLEGPYELGGFYFLESKPEVIWYKPQPFKLRFNDGTETTTYIGDFLAQMDDGTFTVYEVKKTSNLEDLKVKNRLETLKNVYSTTRVGFEVLLSHKLNAQPKFDTLLSLYGQAAGTITNATALETAKHELLLSLRYLGGSAKFSALKAASPLVNETGLAVAIFDGLVTSKYRLPICDGFDVTFTRAGEMQCPR
jgi:hypothetical protein